MHISDILDARELATIAKSPYRRLSNECEVTVPSSALCQSIHVDRLHGAPRPMLRGYDCHSVDSAKREIEALHEIGIERVFLQLLPLSPTATPHETMEAHASILRHLRETFTSGLEIVVDPQGVCMRPNLTWGIADAAGNVDADKTLSLLFDTAKSFAEAGVDVFCTIGRVNYEAKITAAALAGTKVRLMAFSTNSETPNAYIQETKSNAKMSNTGQKILLGNSSEMALRALFDADEGVTVMAQKPLEGFHLLELLRSLITGDLPFPTFLARPSIARLARDPEIARRLEGLGARIADRAPKLRLGAYEVSGTYTVYKSIEETCSPELAWLMLDELYKNVVAAAGDRLDVIIGRNVGWYARNRATLA